MPSSRRTCPACICSLRRAFSPQVNAILEKDLMRVLESSTDQHERRARRADKLSEILAELEEAYGDGEKAKHFLKGSRAQRGGGGGGGGGGGSGGGSGGGDGTLTMGHEVWRRVLAKIHEVAAEQIAAAAEGERRGSLEVYCDDVHAHCLAMLAQALEHAGELLSAYDRDSYEVHVALRTIRTIEQCERLQPAQPIEWRMGRNEADGQAEGDDAGGGRGGEMDSDTDWVLLSESWRRKVDSQMLASFHRRKDALSSFVKGGSERSMKRTFDRRSNSKAIDQKLRERIERIYNPARYAPKVAPKVEQSIEGYLQALDLDGDGLVSREEYDAAFRVMDVDGDGMLTKEEYFLGGALPFWKLDRDGDGAITFEEFQEGYAILDKDKDGRVSRAEFMVHFKPNLMCREPHSDMYRVTQKKLGRRLDKTTKESMLRDEMDKMDRKGMDSETWLRAQAHELQKQLRGQNITKQRRNIILLGEG